MLRLTCAFIAIAFLYSVGFPPGTSHATDYSSTNFTVKDPVIIPGAGYQTSATYKLWSSLGQGAIGLSTTSTFGLKGGFLYFPAASATVTPTPTPTPSPSGGGDSGTVSTTRLIPTRPPELGGGLICDFNNDNRCTIIDFSILLTYFGKPITDTEARYDLNNDRRIDIVDVSILLFYWTS